MRADLAKCAQIELNACRFSEMCADIAKYAQM